MAVILLVLMSMGQVLMTWGVYRDFLFENQERLVSELLLRESDRVLATLEQTAEDVGMYTQHQPQFRKAFVERDGAMLTRLLDGQFDQYHVTAGQLKLVQLYVYDSAFERLASSSRGDLGGGRSPFCGEAVELAKKRQGSDQLKLISGVCLWKGYAYYSVIVPVGGLRHEGYLQLIYDPYRALLSLEKTLAMSLSITAVTGEVIYRSPEWRSSVEERDFAVAQRWLSGVNGAHVSKLEVQQEMDTLMERARQSRDRMLLLAGGLTLLVVAVALWGLQSAMVRPIRELIDQLNRVRLDRRTLRTPLTATGNAEVRQLVSVFNDMSADLSRLYDEYEAAAFIDQLTSLPNRTLFLDRLRQMILMSRRNGEHFGVMLLDLDGFKEVNDALGHQVGDVLLQQIAERLRRTIRASSTVARVTDLSFSDTYESEAVRNSDLTLARLGGDEFAILLPRLKGIEGAVSVAKRISEVLEPHAEIDGNTILVAGTMGISMYPEHGEDAEALLRRADIALYVAKHIQNDFSIYDPAYDTHSVKQLALKAELRAAIEEDQLVLFYQPKLDFQKGSITSVEALVRWQHPQRGMIPPDQFIPLSEQRGLIGPLTEWVIAKALWQHGEWLKQGVELQIAVNLSSRVLYDLSLPNKVENLLTESRLPPTAISFEITEEATMVDPHRALEIMERLNELGLLLSIDDFGTGYSSLGYLKRLPVDEIKIDRSFVMDMEQSDNDAKIVHATIDLAHNLGLRVVAEGVETETALQMLKTLNCDFAQGYYLSRPVPADELLKWLAGSVWATKSE